MDRFASDGHGQSFRTQASPITTRAAIFILANQTEPVTLWACTIGTVETESTRLNLLKTGIALNVRHGSVVDLFFPLPGTRIFVCTFLNQDRTKTIPKFQG